MFEILTSHDVPRKYRLSHITTISEDHMSTGDAAVSDFIQTEDFRASLRNQLVRIPDFRDRRVNEFLERERPTVRRFDLTGT